MHLATHNAQQKSQVLESSHTQAFGKLEYSNFGQQHGKRIHLQVKAATEANEITYSCIKKENPENKGLIKCSANIINKYVF